MLTGETWTSYTGLNDTSGNPLAATLQGVYADEVGVIMYNDEFPPDGPTSFKLAHAKGKLASSLQCPLLCQGLISTRLVS